MAGTECLRALFAAWERVEALARGLDRPCQSWLVVAPGDSGEDAVYLHTPNPNRDNFPYRFEGVVWGAAPPDLLAEFVAGGGLEVGRSEYDGTERYWIRRTSSLNGVSR